MQPVNGIVIRPFRLEDQSGTKALILEGLREHWGAIDPDRNPDLLDIAAAYAGAVFLLACRGEQIIGTGALLPRGNGTAEIVRMSVIRDMRRQGIGGLILRALLERAKAAGAKRIILETTAVWQDAVAFYQKHGFRITHYDGGDAYFVLDLAADDPIPEPPAPSG
jgi:GNAT superfamily N-acetyltransferase